jgi:hypothetical protein
MKKIESAKKKLEEKRKNKEISDEDYGMKKEKLEKLEKEFKKVKEEKKKHKKDLDKVNKGKGN